MEQNEFTRQIERHTAILARILPVSAVAGRIKLLLFPLFGVTLFIMILANFPAALIVAALMECAALAGAWRYHDMTRRRIAHSNRMISINKNHLDRISGMCAAVGGIDTEFINRYYPYTCDPDFFAENAFNQYLGSAHTWNVGQGPISERMQVRFSYDELRKQREVAAELRSDAEFSKRAQSGITRNQTDFTPIHTGGLSDIDMFANKRAIKFLLM